MSHTKPEEKVEVEVIRQGLPIRLQLHTTKVAFPVTRATWNRAIHKKTGFA